MARLDGRFPRLVDKLARVQLLTRVVAGVLFLFTLATAVVFHHNFGDQNPKRKRALSEVERVKTSVPLAATISTCLADMILLLFEGVGAGRTSRLHPCPSARPG
jgi:uncharacterized membrane protein YphA (DoxX/SURF4 family)